MDEEKIKKGGLFYLIRIAYRNIYRSKRRTALCILAIAISTFFVVFMLGFLNGMIKSIIYVIKVYDGGDIVIYTKDFEADKDFLPVTSPIENNLDDLLDSIKKIPSVKNAFPRIAGLSVLTDNNVKSAMLWGIDIDNEFKANYFNLRNKNNGLIKGRFPRKDENGCVVGRELAKKMNIGIGDKIPMKLTSSQYSDKFYNPEVTGIFEFDYSPLDKNCIIIPFNKIQKLLTLKNKTQSIVVFLKNDINLANTKNMIKKIINNDNIVVKTWKEQDFIVLFKRVELLYYAIFGIFIILASFLIINTILMAIYERIKEIGMMGSLGMNKREIIQVFFLEAVILSIIGAFLGAIFGGIITLVISFYPIDLKSFTSKGIDFPTSGTIFIDFSFVYMFSAFFYGVLISAICTIFPSLKAAFVEPVEALRR